MADRGYGKLTRDAALRFLQTAVIVDDAATVQPDEVATESVGTPQRGAAKRAAIGEEHREGVVGGGAPQVPVDVKALSTALADRGITCGILRPTPDETDSTITNRVVKASSQVDLVILDWILDADSELTSLEAIKGIVEQDQRGSRVIAVYTSQESLDEIAVELLDSLDGAQKASGADRMIAVGGTRIALFRKSGLSGGKVRKGKSVYDEVRLADRVVEIFMEAVQGWVRAIALNAMAAMRESVHLVLTRLDPTLDVGYAGNSLRLEHAEEGPRQLLDSLGGEFRDVIEADQRTHEAAGVSALHAWIADRDDRDDLATSTENIETYLAQAAESTSRKELGSAMKALKASMTACGDLSEMGIDEFKREMTAVFLRNFDGAKARTADSEFAMLLALRHPYPGVERTLRLGTIVESEEGELWLCVQPVCDSVRVKGPKLFPMIPLLDATPGEKNPIHIVVRNSSTISLLSNPATPDQIRSFEFDPDPATETVLFHVNARESSSPFIRDRDGNLYEWLGELKPSHANRVAHRLGEKLTRIGLDESVWLHDRTEGR